MPDLQKLRSSQRGAVSSLFHKTEDARGNADFDKYELFAMFEILQQKQETLRILDEKILQKTREDTITAEIIETVEYHLFLSAKITRFRHYLRLCRRDTYVQRLI